MHITEALWRRSTALLVLSAFIHSCTRHSTPLIFLAPLLIPPNPSIQPPSLMQEIRPRKGGRQARPKDPPK